MKATIAPSVLLVALAATSAAQAIDAQKYLFIVRENRANAAGARRQAQEARAKLDRIDDHFLLREMVNAAELLSAVERKANASSSAWSEALATGQADALSPLDRETRDWQLAVVETSACFRAAAARRLAARAAPETAHGELSAEIWLAEERAEIFSRMADEAERYVNLVRLGERRDELKNEVNRVENTPKPPATAPPADKHN